MNKTIRKAFKFRLKVNAETDQKLKNYTGGCRFVWNKALALNLERLNQKQPILRYDALDFWSKLWKQSDEYGFLKDLPSQVLQQKLMDLGQTLVRFNSSRIRNRDKTTPINVGGWYRHGR